MADLSNFGQLAQKGAPFLRRAFSLNGLHPGYWPASYKLDCSKNTGVLVT